MTQDPNQKDDRPSTNVGEYGQSETQPEKQQNPETVKAKSNLGIKMNSDCLVHGGCSLDVYKTL